jgi:hypothetical membrane protein
VPGLPKLIRPAARWGGALFALGSFQFVLAMIVVQLAYPNYSDAANYISDLGNATLSPLAWLFNDSIRVLGGLGILGAALLGSAFESRATAHAGRLFLVLASVGAFLVGTYPEGSPELGGGIHGDASALTFLSAAVALILLGVAMSGDRRWSGYGAYTFLSGLVTYVGIIGSAINSDPGTFGAWERVIVAPILAWGILAGIRLVRLPAVPPSPIRGRPMAD